MDGLPSRIESLYIEIKLQNAKLPKMSSSEVMVIFEKNPHEISVKYTVAK